MYLLITIFIAAAFIRVVGSEFVQKYLGEGPRMVRDVFRLAKENSPAIIFIDEIDAIATKRFDAQTGADREVQRILLELLNQMDGFDQTTNVKVTVFFFVLWSQFYGALSFYFTIIEYVPIKYTCLKVKYCQCFLIYIC